jgi:hypothetical protein
MRTRKKHLTLSDEEIDAIIREIRGMRIVLDSDLANRLLSS